VVIAYNLPLTLINTLPFSNLLVSISFLSPPGKEGVGRWFGMVAANDVIREFEPREFFGGDDHCTVIGWERTADAKTGKEFTSDWLHNFQVKNGKVTRWIGAFDSDARARVAQA